MNEEQVRINAFGFRQFYDEAGVERCPACGAEYTNEGDGFTCCDDGVVEDQGRGAE